MKLPNWIKSLVAGPELDTLHRYRSAVEQWKASSSHDAAVTAWAIYHEAEGDEDAVAIQAESIDDEAGKRYPVGGLDYGWQGEYNRGWNDCIDKQRIDRRSHPFK